MKLFLDSSALAKRYIEESGSARVDELLLNASELGVSVLAVPEIISALCRRQRERMLSPEQYLAARAALLRDVEDANVINPTEAVLAVTMRLLEQHPLRASDAIHVASAQVWAAAWFVSADVRQCTAANAIGLMVVCL